MRSKTVASCDAYGVNCASKSLFYTKYIDEEKSQKLATPLFADVNSLNHFRILGLKSQKYLDGGQGCAQWHEAGVGSVLCRQNL